MAYQVNVGCLSLIVVNLSRAIAVVDADTLQKLEEGFENLQNNPDCKSLLKKHLTREVFDQLKHCKTSRGATLLDVVQSGFANHDSGIGIYAPDIESYKVFKALFDPIIEEYHGGFKPDHKHPATDYGGDDDLVDLDPTGKYVISTRIRCGRSISDYSLNPCMTEDQYVHMEERVSQLLSKLGDDLKGQYFSLASMDDATKEELIHNHYLFKEGDRFLQAANACRFWPTGRGIFLNDAKTFMVWCGEEDHLRIISMEKGGNMKTVYSRLVAAIKALENSLPFARDARLGWLTFCPTNLGTTIRASVHIKLPKTAEDRNALDAIAAKFHLQVRGTRGEHSDTEGGVYDISNKRRLGLTEQQAVMEMQRGILELIKHEESLA